MKSGLLPFFSPDGVSLIGASSNPNKLSNGILLNLTQYGYQGKVYPVNPRYEDILGLTCYPSIIEVPDPIELAVIILPAPLTPTVLDACGQRGIKAVIIISGGFREVGPEGAALENDCVAICKRYGMRLIGPNCVGTVDLYSGLNTTFIKGMPDRGHIGFISQSGAVCGAVVDYVRGKAIGFSNIVSFGNEADVTESDVIEYLSEDINTHVIAAYIEAIDDGQRFMKIAQKVTPMKPIVVLKAGKSKAGARAVSSHTGSLAGSQEAYTAAFKQCGVIVVNSTAELFDVAIALDYQPLPSGSNTVIVTNAGGPAALAFDSLSANGMNMCDLTPQTKSFLHENLLPSAQVDNPVDMLGGAEPEDYAMALQRSLADDNVDAAIAILVPQALVNPVEVAAAISDTAAKTTKSVLSCFMGGVSIQEARQILHKNQVPMYVFPEQLGKVLESMYRYRRWTNRKIEPPQPFHDPNIKDVSEVSSKYRPHRNLDEAFTRPLLEAYGIPIIAGEIAYSPAQAVEVAQKIGLPIAMKIVSPDILHKSEAGGIILNIKNTVSVEKGYQQLYEITHLNYPNAVITGVLVEEMAPSGYEVIVGMRRDPNFGPLLMFGLGGIYVELLTDVSFRIAPMTRHQALEMIHETKAGHLLEGLRGQKSADINAVVDTILRLSQLALDTTEIEEIEINPLLVFEDGKGVKALDARAILSNTN